MDYKKRYEQALERAREVLKTQDGILRVGKVLFEDIFPELAESEDERVRNEIIAFVVQNIHRGGGTPISEEQENKWIAWLEKQKPVPQWMLNFLEECRPKIGCALDYDERREIEGKILAIIKWLEKQGEQSNKEDAKHHFPDYMKHIRFSPNPPSIVEAD